MKRLFTLLLISMVALSCENVDEKLDDTSGKNDVIVFVEGTELTADVPSRQTVLNYKFASTLDWEVRTDAEWLEIDPMSGTAGEDIKIQVKVKKNESEQSRTAYVDLIVANNDNYRITINQAGEGDDVVVEIPNNQIWYTSINGEVVEPYSGWFNDYADALTIFGANIVSNTYKNGLGVITFDRDVTTIGSFAFSGLDYDSVNTTDVETSCIKLESIIIPDSVTTIGVQAFYDCSSLTSVTIPDSVTTIGEGAFWDCDSLTSVTIGDSVTTIGNNAFAWCDSLTNVTIGDSVTTIGGSAFYWCDSLTSVTIPNSVTTIGVGAFAVCNRLTEFKGKFASEDSRCLIVDGILNSFAPAGLTEYTTPNSVTTIGSYAFYGCSSLTSVTIPNSVTEFGDYAFNSCSGLESVTIGDSVTKIGYATFAYCENLNTVYCKAINPPTTIVDNNGYWFGFAMQDESGNICNIDGTIYVPTESVEAYKSASGWSDYADAIVGYNF